MEGEREEEREGERGRQRESEELSGMMKRKQEECMNGQEE